MTEDPGGVATPSAPGERSAPYLLLAIVSLGALLAPLNSTMIAVALPGIRGDFGVSHAALGWLVSAYLVAMAVSQPVAGRLGDQLGRRRLFRVSLVAFLACSLLAALAPSFAVLVILRTGQAIAGAALVPNGMGMLRIATPTSRLGRMNGLTGAIMGISAASGPLIGAAVIASGSWRGIFLVNVPFVVAALVLLAAFGPKDQAARARAHLDLPGIALLAASLVVVTLLLNERGSTVGPGGAAFWVSALALIAAALAWSQRRTRAPVAEWGLFRSFSFSSATLYILLTNLVMYTTLLAIPFFVTEFQGRAAGTTGLLLGAMSVSMAAVAPLSGALADRDGRRRPALLGASAALVGVTALLLGLREDTSYAYLASGLVVVGLGIGIGTGPATTAAIEAAPRSIAAGAAGTNAMMRYAGSILGAGLLAGVLDRESDGVPGLDTFRLVLLVVAAMSALAVLVAFRIHRFPALSQRGRDTGAQLEGSS